MNQYYLTRSPCYALNDNFDEAIKLGRALDIDAADTALRIAADNLSAAINARGGESRVTRGVCLWVVEVTYPVFESVEFEAGFLN